MNQRFRTIDLAYMAIFAVVLAICSWISIPMTIPFTMQTFGIFCALQVLGGKRGTMSILVYILLGAVGIPVFSGFTGGIGILLGTTGGYILGFLLMGLLKWLGERLFGTGTVATILLLIIGLAVCYGFGTVWFMTVYARTAGAIALKTALGWCVLPFILPDLAKLALSLLVSGRIKKLLH